jgi:exosortase F-associated protein
MGEKILNIHEVKGQMTIRMAIGTFCLIGLIAVFIFQRTDVAEMISLGSRPIHKFLINRTIRFLLNDIFAVGIIYALFHERKYVIFSLWVQLAGTFFLLIPYFILKLNFPTYNGPLISYLHRLILNPTLLLLLIPAFYYQKLAAHRSGKA